MASATIETAPVVAEETVKILSHANLFAVFDERDDAKRLATIEATYADDIIWYEPDRVVHGKEALNKRAVELQADMPGFSFSANGNMLVAQNMGLLPWKCGPPAKPDLVKGTDVIIVEGGKVKFLWTAVDGAPPAGA